MEVDVLGPPTLIVPWTYIYSSMDCPYDLCGRKATLNRLVSEGRVQKRFVA